MRIVDGISGWEEKNEEEFIDVQLRSRKCSFCDKKFCKRSDKEMRKRKRALSVFQDFRCRFLPNDSELLGAIKEICNFQ